jgi:hypothetical protein
MSLTYDRTGGGTQECSIQYPQCWYSVGCKRAKWGVRPQERRVDRVRARYCRWVDCVMTAVMAYIRATIRVLLLDSMYVNHREVSFESFDTMFCGTTFRHVPVRCASVPARPHLRPKAWS